MKKLLIIFLAFTSWAALSQTPNDGKKHGITDPVIWSKTQMADKLYNQKSYYNAIDSYKELIAKQPDNIYLNTQLALCYYYARDYKDAIVAFKSSTDLDDGKKAFYPYSWFYYGESLRSLGMYEEAKVAYIKFYRQKLRSLKFKEFTKYAKQANKSCDYALAEIRKDSAYINIEHLESDINHAYSDFAPSYSNETLYFSTLRYDTIISKGISEKAFFPVSIYASDSNNTTWNEPEKLNFLNTPDAHTANVSFNKDGDVAYFSKCWNDPQNEIYCQIFTAKKDEEGNWGKAHKMHHKINTHSYISTQPTLAEIEVRKKRDMVKETVLYFVSDRPGGFGGKDIWYSIIDENGKPGKPINCGKRVNSPRDEITPFYDNDKRVLYFSSNYHTGFGGFDVFSTKGSKGKWSRVFNLGLPINSSYDDTYFSNITQDSSQAGFMVSNRPGGIALLSETCCDDIYQYAEYIPKKVSIDISLLKEVMKFDTLISYDTIYTDTLKSEIVEVKEIKTPVETKQELPVFGAKLGIVKKTAVNDAKKLGRNDIFGVKNEIEWIDTNTTDQPINFSLIQSKEYFVVVQKDSMTSIFQPLNTNSDIYLPLVMQQEIKDTIVEEDTTVQLSGTLASALEIEKVTESQKFLLENLYFDTDKDNIKDAALPSLELLLNFLEAKPKVKIEIAGHTDSQGNDAYNLDLSQRRAESVMQYLINHGIKANRLTAVGYGETSPISDNDTAEGRQLNRRTEIVILEGE